MSFLFFYIIFYSLISIRCVSTSPVIFKSEIYKENGLLAENKDIDKSESVWILFKNFRSTLWLKLKPKVSDFSILIKNNHNNNDDVHSAHCLYSAASQLISNESADIHQQIKGQISLFPSIPAGYKPTNFLSVSLCHGISGIVQLQNETSFVHLIPLPNSNLTRIEIISSTFNHEGFSIRDPIAKGLHNVANSRISQHKRSKRSSFHMPKRQAQGPFLVELYLIVDSKMANWNRYDNYNSLIGRITYILNHINMAFSQFNIYFTVIQLEIWEHDQMKLTDENHILMELQLYKRRFITKRHDCLHAILGENIGHSRRGQSELASMCGYSTCVGYTKDFPDQKESEISHSILHEIGHNFGLHHDTEQCRCYGCIMATGVEFGSSTFQWSNCSKKEMSSLLKLGVTDCLRDIPSKNQLGDLNAVIMEINRQSTFMDKKISPMCGNGVVDEGEHCDCGGSTRCPIEFQRCCNPSTCLFQSGASCAGGACCDLHTCSLKNVGTICRNSEKYSCDLPEFCDGKTEWCPADMHKEDGVSCVTSTSKESAICFRGNCETRHSMCKVLWGDTGYEAHSNCYKMNVEGESVKNCGLEIPKLIDRDRQTRNWLAKKCTDENVMCGRLWCSHDNERVMRPSSHFSVDEMDEKNHHCSAVRFDMNWFMDDPGMVPNGSPCSSGKVCWEGECVLLSQLRGDNNLCYCNGHGICNNYKHCHCDPGFAPPNCTSPGNGGSIDSGPPGKFHSLSRTVVAAVIIILIVILTALLIASFIYHYRLRRWPAILAFIKCPTFKISKTNFDNEKKVDYFKINLSSKIDKNEEEKSVQSPLYPATQTEKIGEVAFKPSSIKEKSKYFNNIQNHSLQNPLLTKPKPKLITETNVVKVSNNKNNIQEINSKILLNKPGNKHLSPKPVVVNEPPIIICEKPSKVTNSTNVSDKKEIKDKPIISNLNAKPFKHPLNKDLKDKIDEKNQDSKLLVKDLAAAFNKEKQPPLIIGQKPQTTKPINNLKDTSKSLQVHKNLNSPIQNDKDTKNVKLDSKISKKEPTVSNNKLNEIIAKNKNLSTLGIKQEDRVKSPPLPLITKPNKPLDFSKPNKSLESSKPNKPLDSSKPNKPLDSSKPNNPFDSSKPNKPLDSSKPNKPLDSSKPNKALESSKPFKDQTISQPRIQQLSNQQSVIDIRPKRLLSPEKNSSTGKIQPKAVQKNETVTNLAEEKKLVKSKDVNVSNQLKLQISQPRLEQTTCTDATRDLPSTDKTLSRTVPSHKILKCEPPKPAVNYV